MTKKIDIAAMLSLQEGVTLVRVTDSQTSDGMKSGETYVFKGYETRNVPVNRQNAVMAWYPDRPIWTPERFEEIRYEFMAIWLEGVDLPQRLKDFDII